MIRIFVFFFFSLISAFQTDGFMNNNICHNAEQAPLLSFGVFADVQYCNCEPAGTRFYSKSLAKLKQAINSFNKSKPAFIINLGDLIDRDYESFDPVLEIINTSSNKVYHVLGNHDFSVDKRYKRKVTQLLTKDKAYQSFIMNGFRFILLNTCDISTYGPSKQNARKAQKLIDDLKISQAPYAFDWNGGLGKKQIEWFREELQQASINNEKVFIFSHHTVIPEGPHNIYNRQLILDILSEYNNIISWFSGHNHTGDYGNFNNIHFVTLRGMVETSDSNSWANIEVYHNKIWIKGHEREKSQILAY